MYVLWSRIYMCLITPRNIIDFKVTVIKKRYLISYFYSNLCIFLIPSTRLNVTFKNKRTKILKSLSENQDCGYKSALVPYDKGLLRWIRSCSTLYSIGRYPPHGSFIYWRFQRNRNERRTCSISDIFFSVFGILVFFSSKNE